jgi:precorrin-6x reductase
MKLLIFAGTTEGRLCAAEAVTAGHTVTVSVATEYGRADLIDDCDFPRDSCRILTGRLDVFQMKEIFPEFDCIIDATHPYAVVVTDTIRTAAATAGIRCIRLLRPDDSPAAALSGEQIKNYCSAAAAAAALKTVSGNIFISTGSRDIAAYSVIPGYQERLWVRVLPSEESLAHCRSAGIPVSHIIALQGPFSVELNEALFREHTCAHLVTKESGRTGGYPEKIMAARRCGMQVHCIIRPQEKTGIPVYQSSRELLAALSAGGVSDASW